MFFLAMIKFKCTICHNEKKVKYRDGEAWCEVCEDLSYQEIPKMTELQKVLMKRNNAIQANIKRSLQEFDRDLAKMKMKAKSLKSKLRKSKKIEIQIVSIDYESKIKELKDSIRPIMSFNRKQEIKQEIKKLKNEQRKSSHPYRSVRP